MAEQSEQPSQQPLQPNCPYVDGNIATLYNLGKGVLCTRDSCPYGDNNLGRKIYHEEEPARICSINGKVEEGLLEKIGKPE